MDKIAVNIISEQALDNAMTLFWEKGYFNTSIEDVIDATGMNRAALYKHFDGKRGLFLAMLERFRGDVICKATAPLQDPTRGIEAIDTFFNQFLGTKCGMMSSHGCFIIATASDIPSHDDNVAEVVNDFINHLRTLFRNIFKFLQNDNQLSASEDPDALADFLVCNVLGLVTIFRSGADKSIARYHVQTLKQFLANLKQGSSR